MLDLDLCWKFCCSAFIDGVVIGSNGMKFLVVILVLGFGLFLWRRARNSKGEAVGEASATKAPSTVPQVMVACRFCGVHLPRSDAVLVDEAAFCSDVHRHKYANAR